jgi:ribulose 1,5-bisphosphate synthetase/thiazole synthase
VRTTAPDQEHSLYQLALRDPLPLHPIIVGAGPAGQMAAYLLALHG